jgi:hypothetical protein
LENLKIIDTDTILADVDLGIGDSMAWVADANIRIEPLIIDWQKYPADGKNGSR